MNLGTFGLQVRRHAQYRNPPILRKEAFLAAEHPFRAMFARLTGQEEPKDLTRIRTGSGRGDGWTAVLDA